METKPLNIQVYTALVTQTGTNAPVAQILHNTLEGEVPTWNRSNTGQYQLLKEGLNLSNCAAFITQSNEEQWCTMYAFLLNDGVAFETYNVTPVRTDGLMTRVTIEIRKYTNI